MLEQACWLVVRQRTSETQRQTAEIEIEKEKENVDTPTHRVSLS